MKNPTVVLLACLTTIILLLGVIMLPLTGFSGGVPVEEGDLVAVRTTGGGLVQGKVAEARDGWLGVRFDGKVTWICLEHVLSVREQ